jgi:hypothetical protein
MSYVGAKPYPIKDGGTGQVSLPANGQLLVGDNGAFDLRNLTAGTGINIVNAPGSITIASTISPPILTPVFIARKTATSSDVTGDGTDYTVIFDTTDANIGLCYDSTTGIFTAPDTDDYIFMFCVTTGDVGAAHTLADMKIVLGSGVTAHGFYGNPYVTAVSGKMQMSQCVGVMVTASDTAKVSFTVSNGTKIVDVIGSANYDTWFAGYRLSGSGGGGGSQVDGVVDGSGNTVSPSGGLITLVNGNNVASLSGSPSHITFNITGTTDHAVQLGNATGSLTSLSAGVPGTTLVSAGAGSDPAFGVAQVIGGGTGLSTLTNHGVVIGQGTSNVALASPGTAGLALVSNGVAFDPSFQVVPTSGGGTGAASLTGVVIGNGASPFTASLVTQNYALVGGAGNTITSVNPSTAGFVLTSNGPGVDPSFQAVGGASLLSTVTDGSGNVVSPTVGNITLVNGANVSSLSGSPSNITLNLTGTTNHAVQVGNAGGSLTSIPSGSSGQALISAGAGSDPAFGVLTVPGGGTGSATLTNHAVLLGQGTSAIGAVGLAAAGLPLVSNGLASDPAYNVLTVPGGGTGATTLVNNAVIIGQGASALSSVGPGASGLPLVGQGASAPVFAALGVPGGGTGATTLTGILTGNGTSAMTASAVSQYTTLVAGASNTVVGVGPGSAGEILTSNGAGANPSYQSISGTFAWTDATNATYTIVKNNAYVTNRGGGVNYTLPASAALGDMFKIVGKLGITTITPNAGQQLLIGSASGTIGVTGTAIATNVGDCIVFSCITAGASSVWRANNFVGSWTLT